MQAYRIVLITLLFLGLLSTANAEPARSLPQITSFAFALGLSEEEITNELMALSKHDLVVVDGEDTSTETISQIKANGAVVLGYLSVGTIEKGRSWFRRVKPFRLELWNDWGEWYSNVKKRRYRRIILRVAKGFFDKGFDGLFLDNVDMIDSHHSLKKSMRNLVKRLSKQTRKRSGFLFTQNGDESIDTFAEYLDGWNREDVTSTYDFDSESYQPVASEDRLSALETIARLKQLGILVTTTDYVLETDTSIQTQAIDTSCASGAIPYVSDIFLTRVPTDPITCPE